MISLELMLMSLSRPFKREWYKRPRTFAVDWRARTCLVRPFLIILKEAPTVSNLSSSAIRSVPVQPRSSLCSFDNNIPICAATPIPRQEAYSGLLLIIPFSYNWWITFKRDSFCGFLTNWKIELQLASGRVLEELRHFDCRWERRCASDRPRSVGWIENKSHLSHQPKSSFKGYVTFISFLVMKLIWH